MAMTIGKLAKLAGVSTATLRYYEEQGLLKPSGRSGAGYRLYDSQAVNVLAFIQRAQRLGFSLADIRQLLPGSKEPSPEVVTRVAEDRFLDLERRLTELKVLRHEMEAFLLDLRQEKPGDRLFDKLVSRVCNHDRPVPAGSTLDWLMDVTGCSLGSNDQRRLLAALEGQHIHLWREGESYSILIPTHDPATGAALAELARLEADCHAHPAPRLSKTEEGFLFRAGGEHAFLFAQLFLALESAAP